ncbi:unnamed protein product [Diamesa serratosioi]
MGARILLIVLYLLVYYCFHFHSLNFYIHINVLYLYLAEYGRVQKDTNFDVLIFTQHWPYTVCYQWQEGKKSNECDLPAVKNSWTIHGIWPTKFHTIGPLFCNNTWDFDLDKLAPIADKMKQNWINIEHGTPLDGLWKHEWIKHGTCTAEHIVEMNDELKYFQKGLDWLEKYSITNLLMSSDIKPSTDGAYALEDIHAALKKKLDLNFAIICYKDRKSTREYLFEIRICFDKTLALASCDGIVMDGILANDPDPNDDILTNCRKDQHIIYPSSAWFHRHQLIEAVREERVNQLSWRKQLVNIYKLVNLVKRATL